MMTHNDIHRAAKRAAELATGNKSAGHFNFEAYYSNPKYRAAYRDEAERLDKVREAQIAAQYQR